MQEIKLAIFQHERLCEDVDMRKREDGAGREQAAKGPLSDALLIPSLHPALDLGHDGDEAQDCWQVRAKTRCMSLEGTVFTNFL